MSQYCMDPDDPAFERGVKARGTDLANAMITARVETRLVRQLLIDVRDEAEGPYGAAWCASVYAWAIQVVTQYLAHLAGWLDGERGEGTFDAAHRETVARTNEEREAGA